MTRSAIIFFWASMPNIFIDTDRQAYYFWGQFSAKGAKMNADMKTLNWSTMQKNILTQKDQYFHEELGAICSGDAAAYKYLDFGRKGTTKAILRVKSQRGGTISLHTDSINGRIIGEMKIPAHANWIDYTVKTQKTNGVHALWLTFEGEKVCDKEELMQIDWIKFK